jgi:small subunit ribosomal protein S1
MCTSTRSKLLGSSTNTYFARSDNFSAEGPVIGIEKSAIYIDLHPYGTGIIYGREFIAARDIIKKIGLGDNVSAKVVDTNNEDGYIELSLKEAKQAIIWGEAQDAIRDKKIFELPVVEANKGGLIINWQGIQGFLPASQLKAEHYPRVADGDKDRILEELKKLVGQKISVSALFRHSKRRQTYFLRKESRTKRQRKNYWQIQSR